MNTQTWLLKNFVAVSLRHWAADNVAYATTNGLSVSGGYGYYEEESAFAVGGSYRMDAFAVSFCPMLKRLILKGSVLGLQWEI